MLSMEFYNPVRIVSGRGALRNFEDIGRFGKRCLIVTGKSSAKVSGALSDAEALFAKAGIEYEIFDAIEPNPLLSTVHTGGKVAREFGADFLLGIGGGSPLDAAKAVGIFAANPDMEPEDIFTAPRKDALPLLAVPTTAGTGSEVTPYSILTVPSIENKKSVAGDDLFPKVAFLDPDYTKSMPVSVTFSTAVDALSHAVEGFFMKKASLVSDALTRQAIPLLAQGLRQAAKAKSASDITCETREKLLYGSALAGMVISRTGTGFVHSTGYMLTYYHDVPHGHANAYFLADFVAFMEQAVPERAKEIYALCGVADADGLYKLISSCEAMPLDLRLPAERLSYYAERTIGAKNVVNAVSVISKEELLAVLQRRLGEKA